MKTTVAVLSALKGLIDIFDLAEFVLLDCLVYPDDLRNLKVSIWPCRLIQDTLTSCQTTLPAPMFKCPTSLLPMRPSGNPTASELASSSV